MASKDSRADAAQYYDLQDFCDDLQFYLKQIPSPDCSILDLGCGTGRLLVPLAESCRFIQGIEISAAMLQICHDRMKSSQLNATSAVANLGDITNFQCGQQFDLILAAFRVFQALETDLQVEGLLTNIKQHLAPNGSAILTMFHPNRPPDDMRENWISPDEEQHWEKTFANGDRVVFSDRRPRLEPESLTLYPELIYRKYRGSELIDTCIQPIVMRCWYPEQIVNLLTIHGFAIQNCWGGYHDEKWAQGSELVIKFGHPG